MDLTLATVFFLCATAFIAGFIGYCFERQQTITIDPSEPEFCRGSGGGEPYGGSVSGSASVRADVAAEDA